MKKQKNKFLTVVFAFIPGASQMYMGFYMRGASMMICAIAVIALYAFFYAPIIALLLPLIWCLSFFDAINLGWSSPEIFAEQADEPFYEHFFGFKRPSLANKPKEKKILAWVLIVAGALVLLNNLYDVTYDLLPYTIQEIVRRFFGYGPRIAAAIFIIALGIWMMKGKRHEIENEEDFEIKECDNENK